MNLLIRINLALGAIFILGALITGYACHQVLQENAKREIVTEAGLMMDSALAIRDYTETEIMPLLNAQMQNEFLPQSVPFYAATQNFLKLHAGAPAIFLQGSDAESDQPARSCHRLGGGHHSTIQERCQPTRIRR